MSPVEIGRARQPFARTHNTPPSAREPPPDPRYRRRRGAVASHACGPRQRQFPDAVSVLPREARARLEEAGKTSSGSTETSPFKPWRRPTTPTARSREETPSCLVEARCRRQVGNRSTHSSQSRMRMFTFLPRAEAAAPTNARNARTVRPSRPIRRPRSASGTEIS